MNAYALREVGFSYGGGPLVLDVPELEIAAGQITVLAGPNGSGKSTLLHLLAFLAEPTRGVLHFFGRLVDGARLPSFRLRASLLLQNPYLFHTSVLGNVEWALKIRGVAPGRRRERSREALSVVGLAGYETRSAQSLSGGEAQRLALARLLALEPEVLLLDEPTNHLDQETRKRIEAILADWVRERGATVVLATHDLGQAYRLGAKTWHLEGGRLRPGGTDNVFRVREAAGEPGTFVTERLRLRVHPPPPEANVLHISPREVILSRDLAETSALNTFRGTVVRAEMKELGEVRVTVDCGEPVVAVITLESWQKLGLTVGQEAVASFKASAVQAV